MDNDTNPFFQPEWLELQRRCLEALNLPQAEEPGDALREQWQQALEAWWTSVSPLMPDQSNSVCETILDRSRSFDSLYEQFGQLFREAAGTARAGEEWQSVLHEHIERMKAGIGATAGMHDRDNTRAGAFRAWHLAFGLEPPDAVFSGMNGAEAQRMNDFLLSLPALGPFRQDYEKLQEWARLWQACQEKCGQYQDALNRLGVEALDRLEEKILRMGRENRTIDSMHQFYDLWMESNEEVFSGFAFSETCSELCAEIIALFMQLRILSRTIMDDCSRQLGLPAGRDMKAVLDNQNLLREAVLDNKKEQQELRATIEDLQAELMRLREQANKPAPGRSGYEDDSSGQT